MRYSKLRIAVSLAPLVILLLIFAFGLLNCLAVSFGYYPAAGLTTLTLDYYEEMFARGTLIESLLYSLYFAFVASAVATVLGVGLSWTAVRTGLARTRFFHLFKIPIIVPHMVCAVLIINLLAQSGLLARVGNSLGIISSQADFPSLLYDKGAFGIILTYLWKEAPFVLIIVMTVMGNINSFLGDAAVNLGASSWQTFRHITLPLCLPSIMTAFIIVFVYSFGAYEIPFLVGATTPKAIAVQAYVEYVYPDLAHQPYSMVLNSVMITFAIAVAYVYYCLQRLISRSGIER
jgi:putative spermidine/putrescine transport system permease protein